MKQVTRYRYYTSNGEFESQELTGVIVGKRFYLRYGKDLSYYDLKTWASKEACYKAFKKQQLDYAIENVKQTKQDYEDALSALQRLKGG